MMLFTKIDKVLKVIDDIRSALKIGDKTTCMRITKIKQGPPYLIGNSI